MYLILVLRLISLKLLILSGFLGNWNLIWAIVDLIYEIFFPFFLAASQITIENTQGIISNTTSVVSEGIGNTFQIAGNSILSHVSETKQGLHNALENFDSQKLFNKGAQKIESAVKATGNGLEYVGKRLNLFNALNNIAKLKSKVPNYVLVQTGQLQPAKQEQTGTIWIKHKYFFFHNCTQIE